MHEKYLDRTPVELKISLGGLRMISTLLRNEYVAPLIDEIRASSEDFDFVFRTQIAYSMGRAFALYGEMTDEERARAKDSLAQQSVLRDQEVEEFYGNRE